MNRIATFGLLALAACRPEPAPEPRVDAPSHAAATPEPELEPEPEPAPPEASLGVVDLGVFSDLDPRVQIELAAERDPASLVAVLDEARGILLLYAEGRPIKAYPVDARNPSALALGGRELRLRPGDHAELAPLLEPGALRLLAAGTSPPPGDRDGDGLPDPLDLELGARKTTLNAARYNQDYFALPYPGGDVPRELGACTDVIVRALRNAGVDLQVEVHADIGRAPRRYPMVGEPNPDIDHRRVRTLLPWFRAHWLALDEAATLQPGDVVFMDTIESRAGPDHIGILGDRRSEAGRLLVANNWTDGTTTQFMDLLGVVAVTDRFRIPPAPEHAGPIPSFATQLLVVRSPSWSSFRAQLQRFERAEVNGAWAAVGEPIPVVLGHAGLGWGRGLHGEGPPAPASAGPQKREGDGRSPAGVFAIGPAYGRAASHATALAYAPAPETLRCVDDPRSRHYAEIVDAASVRPDWASAEAMRRLYALAIVIEHNAARTPAGGSCIFLHAWDGPDQPVTGCTAMPEAQLETLARWLAPGAVLVALPEPAYAERTPAWSLPPLRAGDEG